MDKRDHKIVNEKILRERKDVRNELYDDIYKNVFNEDMDDFEGSAHYGTYYDLYNKICNLLRDTNIFDKEQTYNYIVLVNEQIEVLERYENLPIQKSGLLLELKRAK